MILGLLSILIAIFLVTFIFLTLPAHRMQLRWKTILRMSKLPGPGKIPLLGIVHIFPTLRDIDLLQFLKDLQRNYPRLAAFWVFGVPCSVLFDVEDLEALLGSAHYIQKGVEYFILSSWLQEGLVLSSGEKWHQRRKILTPAFHFKILEDSMDSLNKHARHLVENMFKCQGKPFVAEDLIVKCTLDTICETAMGYSLNLQQDELENLEYLKAVRRACDLAVKRLLNLIYVNERAYALSKTGKIYNENLKFLHNFTEKIIQERKLNYVFDKEIKQEELSKDTDIIGKRRKAFLDILIELDKKEINLFSDKDIREEVDTFMFEGHDTIHSSLVHTLYLLGRHPDIQEKAFQELNEIFGESDRAVTSKDLHEMQYLEKIIKESLRLYPSVPFISRLLTKELKLNNNIVLPVGLNVGVAPFLLHRDPKHYPNPYVFDPERFSVENCKNRHPYAYIPFSAGPRNCIGQKFAMMELKVVLSTVIRFARIFSVNKVDDSKFVPLVILRSKEPIQIKVTSRN